MLNVAEREQELRHKIIVVGLGGSGCRVVNHLSDMAGDRVSLAAVDTDSKSLFESKAGIRLEIGTRLTNGLGAGGDAEVGKHAVEDHRPLLAELTDGAQLVILIGGLGGGTCSGGAPILLDIASECRATTLCLVTQPLELEGPPRRQVADRAVSILRDKADVFILVPNDRLFASVGDVGVAESFSRADDVLGQGIRALLNMILNPGEINLSLSDIRKVVQHGGGICTFAYASAEGENRADTAVQKLLASPMLEQGALLLRSSQLVLSITGGTDMLWPEVNHIGKRLREAAPKDAQVALGTAVDKTITGKIMVALVLAERAERTSHHRHDRREPARNPHPAPNQPTTAAPKHQDPQTTFPFGGETDRFKGTEPSVFEGEDLDIPTFLRRNMAIDR